MSVGTAFHPRTAPLNRRMAWGEWAGYFAAALYHDHLDIEYNAIREAAALIDVSPLYKYVVSGPDATHLVDRVACRDATRLAVGRVMYTPWCDERGKVIDDGTVARLDDTTYRWTAADPCARWFALNARGLDVRIDDVSDTMAAVALQGPRATDVLEAVADASFGDLPYFGRRPAAAGVVAFDVTRTGYTGDLGYELWVDAPDAVALWDALMDAGRPHGLRPAGIQALDVVRVEAGLILIEVDYTSARQAVIPEQAYSPFEIGLGGLVDLDAGEFVGRRALLAERAAGGPPRRLVGLEIDWSGIERAHAARGLSPEVPATTSRAPVPLFARHQGRVRQIGRATSTTWSPTLKAMIALASVEAAYGEAGTELMMEWTVEAHRTRVPARVVPTPFFDPPRKRATTQPTRG